MLKEIDYITSFGFAIYQEPDAYQYNASDMLDRIIYMLDLEMFKNYNLSGLLEKATESSSPVGEKELIGKEAWKDPNALINRILRVEETRVTNQEAWQKFKKILLSFPIR